MSVIFPLSTSPPGRVVVADRIDACLAEGIPLRCEPQVVRMASGAQAAYQSWFVSLSLFGEGEIYCRFVPDVERDAAMGIVDLGRRQAAFYRASQILGLGVAMPTVLRRVGALGPGAISALEDARTFLKAVSRDAVVPQRVPIRQSGSLGWAVLACYLLGSGQSVESGLVCDPRGRVWSRLNHQAFSYSADRRLEEMFARDPRIPHQAWADFERKANSPEAQRSLRAHVAELLGENIAVHATRRIRSVAAERRVGGVRIEVGA